MKILKLKNILGFLMVSFTILPFSLQEVLYGADIPDVEDVIEEKAVVPTIEALTGGKVKEGDLINKDNVDLVKEYISPGLYETVKQGFVMRIGKQVPPEKMVPEYFKKITRENRGKAIIDENGTAYYENMETRWPGGVPFPNPQTGLEAVSNFKYGYVYDAWRMYPSLMKYTNAKGKTYKTAKMEQLYYTYNTRTKNAPLGAAPGYENILYKRISIFHTPLELKGIGQYTVRHYDDAKHFDKGFAYISAFKRTIRVSATTWQDNIGGSDWTYGDGGGLADPLSYWKFKLITKRYMLLPEPDAPFSYVNDETGDVDERLQFTVGKKFPIFGWAIWPVVEVEGTPTIKHVYGKKTFFINLWPYWPSAWAIGLVDLYDRQQKLWKINWNRRDHRSWEGQNYTATVGGPMYDLQTQHMTEFWVSENPWKATPSYVNLDLLFKLGR